MEKIYPEKSFRVFIGFIHILLSILVLSSISTVSSSYAQEKKAVVGRDKIKAILLGQEKWIGEVELMGGRFLNDYVFEDHGKKMTVIINADKKNHCKQKVQIFSSGFRMAGCTLGIADLYYDPDDPVYPFKTKENRGKAKSKKSRRQYGLKLKAPETAEPQGIFGSLLNFIDKLAPGKNK